MAECGFCGAEFVSYNGVQRYCSAKCRIDNRTRSNRLRRQSDPEYAAAHNARTRKWHAENPDGVLAMRTRYRAKKYGLSTEEADELLKAKECECCGGPFCEKGPHFDHDHSNGVFRGVLCFSCNVGIGHLGDTVEGLMRAVNYLENKRLVDVT